MPKPFQTQQYSGFFRRFGAAIIDIQIAPLIVAIFVAFGLLSKDSFLPVSFIIYPIYSIFSIFFFGMTIGKWTLGIRVQKEGGEKPSLFSLIRREIILKPMQIMFFGIGIWPMFANDKKQTLYDKRLNLVVTQWRKEWILPLFILLLIVGELLNYLQKYIKF
jgi:uncharacterized RDD family membrane protein YckC